jgi:hypothetical protein
MEEGGSHVVPLLAVSAESLDVAKEVTKHIERGFAGVAEADFADAFKAELLVLGVAGIGEAIGAEKKGVPGKSCTDNSSYGTAGKSPGGRPATWRAVDSEPRRKSGRACRR